MDRVLPWSIILPFLYRTDTGLEVKLDGALSLTSIRATSTYVCLVANVVGSAVARSTVSLGTRYVYIFYLFTYYKQTKRFLWLCTLKVLSVSGQFDKVIRFLHFVESTYRAKEEFAQTLTCMLVYFLVWYIYMIKMRKLFINVCCMSAKLIKCLWEKKGLWSMNLSRYTFSICNLFKKIFTNNSKNRTNLK